jgi:DNA-binding PadR family transcriptional regulator
MAESTQVIFMDDFEILLLRLVAKGDGKWSWYEIGNRLPGDHLHRAPEMYTVLEKLAKEGFIVLHPAKPLDKWELTLKGREVLEALSDHYICYQRGCFSLLAWTFLMLCRRFLIPS